LKADFEDGSLVRVRPSANPVTLSKNVSINENKADEPKVTEPVYLYFMEKEGDNSTESDDDIHENQGRSLLGSINQGTRFRAKSAGGDSLKGSTFPKGSNDKLI